jgi:hypothetical protein
VAPLGSDNEPRFEKVTDKNELIDLRDTQQLSWAKVAEALGLGSPGAARRLYSAAVRPHAESLLRDRASAGAKVTPVHLADAGLSTIRDSIVGKTIVVQRNDRTEDIHVAKVTSLKSDAIVATK